MRCLATVDREAPGYTMALTLPGRFEHMSRAFCKRAFLRLCDRFTAKSAKSYSFQSVGFFWKQELQKRGAIHFHLLFYGITPDNQQEVHLWFTRQWNDLVAVGLREEEKQEHFNVHIHPKNFEAVRNIHGYFAKYLGKAETDLVADEAIPGRWWGKVQQKAIPFAEEASLELPLKVAVYAQRVARKIRQKRADAAKHTAQMRKIGMTREDGSPLISQFGLLIGRRSNKDPMTSQDFRVFQAKAAVEIAAAHRDPEEGFSDPVRFGRFRLPQATRFSGVKLVGVEAPSLALRILRYAGERFREHLANSPF